MGYRLSPQFVGFLVNKYSPRQRQVTLDNFIVSNVQLRCLTDAFRPRDKEGRGTATFSYEDFVTVVVTSIL